VGQEEFKLLQEQMASLGIYSREDLEKEIRKLEFEIEMELQMMDQKVVNL
jgi:hypothetical protein